MQAQTPSEGVPVNLLNLIGFESHNFQEDIGVAANTSIDVCKRAFQREGAQSRKSSKAQWSEISDGSQASEVLDLRPIPSYASISTAKALPLS